MKNDMKRRTGVEEWNKKEKEQRKEERYGRLLVFRAGAFSKCLG